MEKEPQPPPIDWTMREAVAALLPDLLAVADGQPPRDWWMAGGAEYKANERAELRRAFARIMEAGLYRATGLVKGQELPIAPALWRAATFGLGLPGERVSEDILYAGGKSFKGVRVNRPALEDAGGTRAAAGSSPAPTRVQATDSREQDFTGPVPERWCAEGAWRGVWDFDDAASILSQDELHRLVQINSFHEPPGSHIMPQPRDIYAPGLAEAWWEPNDMHTPILLQRLLRGELRAFGDPGQAGAWPEWIAPRTWRDLRRDPGNEQRFEGGGNVYWHVRMVPRDVVLGKAADASRGDPLTPPGVMPHPAFQYWLAWKAVAWRAFGTLDTPAHIVRHRSFDGGTSQLPDESDSAYAVRQEEHRHFDAAERELLGLLADGRANAIGNPPASRDGKRLQHAFARTPVAIPAITFLNQQLAFDASSGGLVSRLPLFEREFDAQELHGSDADPRFPLYSMVLVKAAGLREAWDAPAEPAIPSAAETAIAAETTAAAEGRFTAWLTARIRQAPDSPPGKPAILEEAGAAGFQVSTRAFVRAWAKAVQEANAPAWSSPGRKSKRRIETPT